MIFFFGVTSKNRITFFSFEKHQLNKKTQLEREGIREGTIEGNDYHDWVRIWLAAKVGNSKSLVEISGAAARNPSSIRLRSTLGTCARASAAFDCAWHARSRIVELFGNRNRSVCSYERPRFIFVSIIISSCSSFRGETRNRQIRGLKLHGKP